uniref:DNA polymerase subunit gamma-1 n=1 Tax=Clastoptera arizonana TaxID=38151 RepID=A0A1B6D0L6_9HEMI
MHHVRRQRNLHPSFNYHCIKNKYFSNDLKSSNIICGHEYIQQHLKFNQLENENNAKENNKLVDTEKDLDKSEFERTNNHARFNTFNIQMVSKSIFNHLFPNIKKKELSPELVETSILDLQKHGLMTKDKITKDVQLNLPKLQGKDIEEHFYNIGEIQSAPYRNHLLDIIGDIPKMPSEWSFQPGWTRYSEDGATRVDFPEDDALVFDIEVCCSEGDLPTMATAVSRTAWYSWVSQDLVTGSKNIGNKHYLPDFLIPLESSPKQRGYKLNETFKRPRIVIGHNVSYDRARVKEQYWLERTGLRFLDTMSMHVCVSGVTSYQKMLLKAGVAEEDDWSKLSSLNNLSKVHNLYCGSELSKEERNVFVSGTLLDIKKDFQMLMSYCASDVIATHNILSKLLPLFLERFPHPVTLAGMLELGLAYLPINSNWERYISDSHQTYEDLDNEAKFLLAQHANQSCQLLHNQEYKNNLWLWDQDWTVKELKLKKTPTKKIVSKSMENLDEVNKTTQNEYDDWEQNSHKELEEKFKYLMNLESLIPVKAPHLAGYPEWYRKLCPKVNSCDWTPGPDMISTGLHITPKLLSLTWKGLPLHFVRGHGWGQLVPFVTEIKIENDNVPLEELVKFCHKIKNGNVCQCQYTVEKSPSLIHEDVQNSLVKFICKKNNKKFKKPQLNDESVECFCKASIGNGYGFVKLPHKDGKHLNVGNPLAKDFIYKFSKNELASSDPRAERVIEISRMLSYWRNNRERVEKQLVVWLGKRDKPKSIDCDELGAILPQVVVSGTLTRRAVEPTWMTASNALDERVGSELRAMVQAPPGYCLIGADVDSQELWIASVIGDAYSVKEHGGTPFGWMTLSGQKSEGTDTHSVTAKAVGISRNNAKIINYARIYGAGQPFAERLLKQFNPGMTAAEAKQKALKMFTMTKGTRVFPLKTHVFPELKQRLYNRFSANEICSVNGKSVEELFDKTKWIGGTESAMFNCLEEIALNPEPKTPFLKGRLSRALEPRNDTEDRFIPTRVNWVVQSGAVDFLHLMLVNMRWLLGPDIRFCLSFHDEVRYIVPEELKYQAALALHATNLFTRAFCVQQLGMSDLPQSIAFFSSVEVDKVLRKEANDNCKTPSNPHGLTRGYGIPLGESLDIYECIEKAKGVVGIPRYRNKKNK